MTPTPNPRASASLRRYANENRGAALPPMERLLRFIGAELSFADDVLGDLAQERARRVERDGARSASWWYVREGVRSAPHLAWNAVVHGGPSGRARVAAVGGAMALVMTLSAMMLRVGEPVPVRLEVDGQRATASDGVVVNTRHPVLLAMRAFDAKGRALKTADIQYRWMSGAPVPVSAKGVVTCSYAGDVLLRASLGGLATTVRIHCLPVKKVRSGGGIDLLVGGPSQELAFVALDPDGLPVSRLAGVLRIEDSTVATLENGFVRPVAPGATHVHMRFGEGVADTYVRVFERIGSFAELRREQYLVVAPLRLARGETIRWPLPLGLFWLSYRRTSESQPIPALSVEGPIMCMPDFEPTEESVGCLARGPGASLRISHPGTTTADLIGSFSLERQRPR